MEIKTRFDEQRDRKFLALTLLIVLVIIGGGFAVRTFGQKGVPPLTDAERLNLRNLAARRAIAYQELQQSKPYLDAQESDKALQDGANTIFAKRKILQTDWTICDGDGAPICQGVPKGSLELRPIPKQPQGIKHGEVPTLPSNVRQ